MKGDEEWWPTFSLLMRTPGPLCSLKPSLKNIALKRILTPVNDDPLGLIFKYTVFRSELILK